jgi:hypothetical protein
MINAKEELIASLEKYDYKLKIKAAEIRCENLVSTKYIDLKVEYSDKEMKAFLKELDFEYYDDNGNQNIFGIIWLIDGLWFERKGIIRTWYEETVEMWVLKGIPQIPERLYL